MISSVGKGTRGAPAQPTINEELLHQIFYPMEEGVSIVQIVCRRATVRHDLGRVEVSESSNLNFTVPVR
jgi:hypothetical protein